MIFKSKYIIPTAETLYRILKWGYFSNGITRRIVNKYIDCFEGGQFYSASLRRIYKEVYDIEAGIGTYGCFTTNFRPHVKIGNYCSIAPGVQRLVGNHPMNNVSTHPIFYSKDFGCVTETNYEEHRLTIGNDVWIGVNAIITGNCEKIGDGAVIGAGSVVTHNVPNYAIVAGNPARVLRYRFSDEEQEKLINSEWYKRTPEQLKSITEFADNIDAFLEHI